MTGLPAVALPAGTGARSGLPVGVSLIARRGGEAPLVQAGIDLQEHALAPPVPAA
jgi:aspartyl-tRNA(Asn)/glutamyl-tRNA(Gln) amidotransferase subunit A